MAANLADLRRSADADSSLIAQFEAQLGGLAALNRQIDTASPVALAMLRATVAASVSASSALGQQASAAASNAAQSAAGASLAAASAAARQTVTSFERDMYERKIFDGDLHFASAEDKEEYRKREAERFAETEQAKAEHTPQGDLRAVNLSIEQLQDAGAHGADKNSEYQRMMGGLVTAKEHLAAQIADPQKAPEPKTAAKTADPLDDVNASAAVDPALIASLRAAGVAIADQNEAGHGVTARDGGASVSRAIRG